MGIDNVNSINSDDDDAFGIRLYGRDYLMKLLPVKLKQYGITVAVPWMAIQRKMRDVNNIIITMGYRVVWLIDADNQNKVNGAFMLGKMLDIPVEAYLDSDNGDLRWRGAAAGSTTVLRLCPASHVRRVLLDTGQIPAFVEPTVTDLIARLYADNLIFACLSPETLAAVDGYFDAQDEDRTDIRVRIRC